MKSILIYWFVNSMNRADLTILAISTALFMKSKYKFATLLLLVDGLY